MNKNWIKIASIYIGTVIGAGFASGREIIEFFAVYGIKGILGMICVGILFSVVGSLMLIKIYNNKIQNLDELTIRLFGEKSRFILNTIIGFSLFTGYSVMISGSGAIFKEELGLLLDIGILVMVICSFIVFLFKLEGLSFINSILVPLLIIGILFTSSYLNIREEFNFSNIEGVSLTKKGNFLSSALLYFGSNSLIIIIVFSSLLPLIKDVRTAILGATVGGTVLFILGVSILISMLIYYNETYALDIPMLKMCSYISKNYRKVYSIILWIAMFTTALANGFGFMNKISKYKNRLLYTALFCISAIPLAKLGFANLVGIIYPIFGLIGLGMMLLILLY
ncbi:hypothetical protein K8M07_09035 [Schnuerera sp. xch1]|uniref:YkvI family membrane protein n=1 Tax=Schnuerera sp. xch1 TaxID=2874283 RepID=UPI001CBCF2E6|nr:hypothetical protein [Schnuerera sp. xch1]MBZ2175390.1 hypothetical protein [Schnuerera sp. xch1]